MGTIVQKKLYRIVDANFNRAKEGLRVCEDICRFVLDEQAATQKYKLLRHQLTKAMSSLNVGQVVAARDIEGDVGRSPLGSEFKRREVADIFYANSQRAKESIRVLEEFAKLWSARLANHLKAIRYQIYALEKKIVAKL